MKINSNISALHAMHALNINNSKSQSSLIKLSTGYRINSVSDDPTGLAVSNKMKAQIEGLKNASKNSSDGISLAQTAEGALQEINEMLKRIRELSVQSANGVYTTEDRMKMEIESQQLLEEIDSITQRTEFNNVKLFNGNASLFNTVSDISALNVLYLSESVSPGTYVINVTDLGEPAETTSGNISNLAASLQSSGGGKITINGADLEIDADDDNSTVLYKLQELCNNIGLDLEINGDYGGAGGGKITLATKHTGTDQKIEIGGDSNLILILGLTEGAVYGKNAEINSISYTALGESTPYANFSYTSTISGNRLEVSRKDGEKFIVDLKDTGTVDFTVEDFGELKLQIGQNAEMRMGIYIPKISSQILGLDKLNLSTEDGSKAAIAQCDAAVDLILEVRGKLGAYQNRLEHTIKSLDNTTVNSQEALSRIIDTDMAEEMTKYTMLNVLTQSGISVLAQANERPQQLLQLLR